MKTATPNTSKYLLTMLDRCDQCDGQAFVMVKGVSGELTFCAHHFAKIENATNSYDKLKSFAYEIIDEREKLITNNKS